MSRYLKKFVLEEIEQDSFKKGMYENLREIVSKQVDCENEKLKEFFIDLCTDSYYCILKEDNFHPQTLEKLSNLKRISTYKEKSNTGGCYSHNKDNNNEVKLNLWKFLVDNAKEKELEEINTNEIIIEELVKILNHEFRHAVSAGEKYMGFYEDKGHFYPPNQYDYIGDLNEINEIYTVLMENNVTSKYFNVPSRISSISYNTKNGNEPFRIDTNLFGYQEINIYSLVLDALEGDRFRECYSKISKNGEIIDETTKEFKDYLEYLHNTYDKFNSTLKQIMYKSTNDEDFYNAYEKANREILKIAKDKIDNGMSVDEYFKMSSAFENMNFSYKINHVFIESIKAMDLYYFYNGIFNDKNKDLLSKLEKIEKVDFESPLTQEMFKHLNEDSILDFEKQVFSLRSRYMSSLSNSTKEFNFERNLEQLILEVPKPKEYSWETREDEENIWEISKNNHRNHYLVFSKGTTEEEKFIKDCLAIIDMDSTYSFLNHERFKDFEHLINNFPTTDNFEEDKELIERFAYTLNTLIKLENDDFFTKQIIGDITSKNKELFLELIKLNDGELLKNCCNPQTLMKIQSSSNKLDIASEEILDIFYNTLDKDGKRKFVDVISKIDHARFYDCLRDIAEKNTLPNLGYNKEEIENIIANLASYSPAAINGIYKNCGEEYINGDKIVKSLQERTLQEKASIYMWDEFIRCGGLNFTKEKDTFLDIIDFHMKKDALDDLFNAMRMSVYKKEESKGFEKMCEILCDKNMGSKIFDSNLLRTLEPNYRIKIVRDLLNKDFGREAFVDKEEVDKFRDSVIDFIIRNNLNNVENEELCNEVIRFAIENDDFKRFSVIINEDFKFTKSMEDFLPKEIRFMEKETIVEIYKILEEKVSKETLSTFGKIAIENARDNINSIDLLKSGNIKVDMHPNMNEKELFKEDIREYELF